MSNQKFDYLYTENISKKGQVMGVHKLTNETISIFDRFNIVWNSYVAADIAQKNEWSQSILKLKTILIIRLSDKDKNNIISKIPSGFLNATVGLVIIGQTNNTIVKKVLSVSLSIVEARLTFNVPKNADLTTLEGVDNILNIINTSYSVINTVIDK